MNPFLERAIELAHCAELEGNLPIGAVLVLDNQVIAEGKNGVAQPSFMPGSHAEMNALAQVPPELWKRAKEMVCYTTLEPCLMCMGALILHGVGRVCYGAKDQLGGAGYLLEQLPPFYTEAPLVLDGPLAPERCDALYQRADALFRQL